MKIHAGLMTMNELCDLKDNIERVLPGVDSLTIVDGGSSDGTIIYLRNLIRQNNKVRMFIHPWQDNFPAQRNNYLKHISEIASDGDWVLAFDADEILDKESVDALRSLVDAAEKTKRNMVGFRCRSVSYRANDRVWQSEDNYWKRLLMKWSPELGYSHCGNSPVHESIVGIHQRIVDAGLRDSSIPITYWYEHRKQENVIWQRGMRNYFCGGGGPNLGKSNHRWIEMRLILDSIGIKEWNKLWVYMVAGNVDQRFKDWMIKYKDENGWDGSSEQRECYKSYFRLLHPEEEPEAFKGVNIP